MYFGSQAIYHRCPLSSGYTWNIWVKHVDNLSGPPCLFPLIFSMTVLILFLHCFVSYFHSCTRVLFCAHIGFRMVMVCRLDAIDVRVTVQNQSKQVIVSYFCVLNDVMVLEFSLTHINKDDCHITRRPLPNAYVWDTYAF